MSLTLLHTLSPGTNGMPPDLQRIVNLIKALDDKAAGACKPHPLLNHTPPQKCSTPSSNWLSSASRATPSTSLPLEIHPPTPRATPKTYVRVAMHCSDWTTHTCFTCVQCDPQVATMRAQIEDKQRLLILYVEEKVGLASQAQDLIQHHLQRLNHDMREFEEEMKVRGW